MIMRSTGLTRTLLFVVSAGVFAAILGTAPLSAQGPLTLELRGGWAIPTGSFTRGPAQGGAMSGSHSFGARFGLERKIGLDLLVGFSQYRVDCARDGCGGDEEWVSTQWEVGLRWKGAPASVRPWVTLSAVLPRVERDRPTGPVVSSTGIGAEVGLGAMFQLADRWFLTPGVRYAAFAPDFGLDGRVKMRLAIVQLGLLISF